MPFLLQAGGRQGWVLLLLLLLLLSSLFCCGREPLISISVTVLSRCAFPPEALGLSERSACVCMHECVCAPCLGHILLGQRFPNFFSLLPNLTCHIKRATPFTKCCQYWCIWLYQNTRYIFFSVTPPLPPKNCYITPGSKLPSVWEPLL